MLTLGMILLSVLLSGLGQLLLRAGSSTQNVGIRESFLNASILGGLALWCVSTLLWLLVLRRAPLSYAYCLGSLNYIFVPLASRWLFCETLSPLHLAGMVLIFCGVLLTIYANFQPTHF